MLPVLRGDVFVAILDPAEGSEQGGTRRVVVVSRDSLNKYSPVVCICPITDAENKKRVYPSHVPIPAGVGGQTIDGIVVCEQVRTISKTRLRELKGKFDRTVMTRIDAALKIALDL
ncbi:MAG: type II toxin-antitoxin system PemK/MazF family toxin [Terriglobales bacterium]